MCKPAITVSQFHRKNIFEKYEKPIFVNIERHLPKVNQLKL